MEIETSFRIDAPIDEAWRVLLDLERIAPCVPGAELREIEGDDYRGTLAVTVGTITAQYQGHARLEAADEATHTAVLAVTGRDTGGRGNASASIQLVLLAEGTGTRVDVETDLSITGKVAQFGHDVIGAVANQLLAEFVENLERDVLHVEVVDLTATESSEAAATDGSGEAGDDEEDELVAEAVAAGAQPAASPSGNGAAVRKLEPPAAEPEDRLEVGGSSLGRRLAPLAGSVVIVLVIRWLLRRRSGSGS